MYKIIGGDQKEYGPVTADQLRQWVAEGRVNLQTRVQAEGATEWKTVGELPEFANLRPAEPPPTIAPAYAAPPGLPPDIFTRDYDLDIGRCVGDAWNLMKNNFGLIVGGAAIFMLIEIAMGGLGAIPFVGPVFSLANIIIYGPLIGGINYFLLKAIRRAPVEMGDIFAGFRLAFGQLLLGYLVLAILICLSAVPGAVMMGVSIFLMISYHAASAGLVALAALGFLIAFVPLIYLSVSWAFTLPLIIRQANGLLAGDERQPQDGGQTLVAGLRPHRDHRFDPARWLSGLLRGNFHQRAR